jgi:O-antigen ligase/Flp pilus assembly protein TadD
MMIKEKILENLDLARAAALLLGTLGILLWQDPLAADPLSPKTFCFASCAALLAALTAMRLWWGAKWWLPRNLQGLVLLALMAAQVAAFMAAQPRARSEWAFNGWLLLLLLLLSVYDMLGSEGMQKGMVMAIAAAMAVACLWALAQLGGLHLSPMDQAAAQAFGSRISAGFGNPNFMGGFLVLSLPCAWWLTQKQPWAWILVALGAFCILATGHKAAWLGLGAQYLCYGHLSWHGPQPLAWRKRFLKLWLAIGLGGAALGLAGLPGARERLIQALHPGSDSIEFRIQTWGGALSAFVDKPLMGHGQGSFSSVYPGFRPQAAMASQVQHSYEVTHPENWILQLLDESGLLGLAALVLFLALLLRPLWAAAMKGEAMALALMLSFAGSLICNLASLDLFLPSTFFFFTLLAALAMRRYGGTAAGIGIQAEPYAALMLSACLLFLASFPALQALAHWRASADLLTGRSLSQAGRFDEAVTHYDAALQGDPLNTEALYFKGASLLDSGKPADALASFDELQGLAPDFVLVHDKRARAYRALGQAEHAEAEWARQLQLDPWMLPAVQDLSALYASQGKLAQAAHVLEGAKQRFPDNREIPANLKLIQDRMR